MSEELNSLARWAIDNYAANRDSDEAMLAPLLTVVGGDYDAMTTVGDIVMGSNDVACLSFLIGYVGYPCDAVYITCAWESLSIERDVAEINADPVTAEDLDETTRVALMCWAHAIPTNESVLMMLNRHVNDDGSHTWQRVSGVMAADLPVFLPLREAAHAFDPYPIQDEALIHRQEAMKILIEANGATHDSLFYEPGTLLEAARKHTHR